MEPYEVNLAEKWITTHFFNIFFKLYSIRGKAFAGLYSGQPGSRQAVLWEDRQSGGQLFTTDRTAGQSAGGSPGGQTVRWVGDKGGKVVHCKVYTLQHQIKNWRKEP